MARYQGDCKDDRNCDDDGFDNVRDTQSTITFVVLSEPTEFDGLKDCTYRNTDDEKNGHCPMYFVIINCLRINSRPFCQDTSKIESKRSANAPRNPNAIARQEVYFSLCE